MKKIICLILASMFYLLGIIGLIIPIVPQIPFFIIGTIFLIIGFKRIKEKILESKLYEKYLKDWVNKNNLLRKIFENRNEINK